MSFSGLKKSINSTQRVSSQSAALCVLVFFSGCAPQLKQLIQSLDRPSGSGITLVPDSSGEGSPLGETEESASAREGQEEFAAQVPVNSIRLPSGVVLPLYPVLDSSMGNGGIALLQNKSEITAFDAEGKILWTSPSVRADLGGFDFNGDGWTDFGWVDKKTTQKFCGKTRILRSKIIFVDGKTGATSSPLNYTEDRCTASDAARSKPLAQWTPLSVLFGSGTSQFVMIPLQPTIGYHFGFEAGNFLTYSYFYPPFSAEFSTYEKAQTQAPSPEDDHPANGLVIQGDGENRLVYFTTQRVVDYRLGILGTRQLVAEKIFPQDGKTDLEGKNLGLVSADPQFPQHLSLLSGTSMYSVYADMKSGKIQEDPLGQIERHVAIYDSSTQELQDRFYSRATDATSEGKYENRVAYPGSPWVRTKSGSPSRLAYNVFREGHWEIHLSEAGSVEDRQVMKDLILWDVQDLDGDGIDEWVISPAPSGYFPKWETSFYHWSESKKTLLQLKTFSGIIPELIPRHREKDRTTTLGVLYPVSTWMEEGRRKALMISETKTLISQEVSRP